MKQFVIIIIVILLTIGAVIGTIAVLGPFSMLVWTLIFIACLVLIRKTAPAINKQEMEELKKKHPAQIVFQGSAHDILQKHWAAFQALPDPKKAGVSTSYRPDSDFHSWQLLSGNGAYQLEFRVYLWNDTVATQRFEQHRYYSLFTAEQDNVYSLEMKQPNQLAIDIFTSVLADIFGQTGNQVPVHQLGEKW